MARSRPYEAALMSHYLVMPRKGHLEQAYCIFARLKKYNRSKIVFDHMPCDWKLKFIAQDWKGFIQMQKRTHLWTYQRHVEIAYRLTHL
eukprot:5382548-Ditylum_brightwellii.AAC.1